MTRDRASAERSAAVAMDARARLAKQKKAAFKTFHNWDPWDKPLVARNPNPNAPAAEKYVVLENIKYRNAILELPIAKGFLTDLGSIPRPFQNLISPDGRGFRAFLAHDVMYRQQRIARVIADAILWSILIQDGVGTLTAFVIHRGVRWFGWMAWEENAKRNFHAKADKVFEN